MRRITFDRDDIALSAPKARGLSVGDVTRVFGRILSGEN